MKKMSLEMMLGIVMFKRVFIYGVIISLLLISFGNAGAFSFKEGESGNSLVFDDLQRPGLDGWFQLISDGFGHDSNLATRGMVVYKDELYIGTQNVNLPKIYEDTFPVLYNIISRVISNDLIKSLQRTILFKVLFRYIHQLRAATMNKIVHVVVRSSEGCEIWKYNFTLNNQTLQVK